MTIDWPAVVHRWAGQTLAWKNGKLAALFFHRLNTAHASRLRRHALLIWRDAAAAAAAAIVLEAAPLAQQEKLPKCKFGCTCMCLSESRNSPA